VAVATITFAGSFPGKTQTLPTFAPTSLGLNPTQIYETISMCLLLFFLLSYFPYKQRDGELFVQKMPSEPSAN
jgi:ABC-type molybdate transport system permease subunit